MNSAIKIAAFVIAGAMVAGCSSLGRAKGGQEMDTRVAALEGQVTHLSNRVDEMGATQPAPSGFEVSSPGSVSSSSKKLTVRQTQRALTAAGFYKGPVDGKEGPKTKQAVKEFQQANGLKVDGVVGSTTRQALAKYLTEPQG